eukprot:g137.t1
MRRRRSAWAAGAGVDEKRGGGARRPASGAKARRTREEVGRPSAMNMHHPKAALLRTLRAEADARGDGALLDRIAGPADVRKLPASALRRLADEVRGAVIDIVSGVGGHLGAGLGVVELTVALHHVFDTPDDKLIWDAISDSASDPAASAAAQSTASPRARACAAAPPCAARSPNQAKPFACASQPGPAPTAVQGLRACAMRSPAKAKAPSRICRPRSGSPAKGVGSVTAGGGARRPASVAL